MNVINILAVVLVFVSKINLLLLLLRYPMLLEN